MKKAANACQSKKRRMRHCKGISPTQRPTLSRCFWRWNKCTSDVGRFREKAGRISSRVQYENGNAPPDADVLVAGYSKRTDTFGHFDFMISGEQLKPDLELQAIKTGFLAKHFSAVPNGNDVIVRLTRAP
jgi:hypothetical protein